MKITSLIDDFKDYVNTQIDIIKLNIVSKIEKAMANTVLAVALCVLGIFTLLFLSISAALAISSYSGKPFLGFLLVGGFYLLLTIGIIVFKQKILNGPIINSLLKKVKYKRH